MNLADLTPRARRERIMLVVDGILREIDKPISTAELVKRVTSFLKAAEGAGYVAKELQKATPTGHPNRVETGETFKKYGKTMKRYEWAPAAGQSKARADKAIAERRARIAALEAGNTSETEPVDEWTWTPGDGDPED